MDLPALYPNNTNGPIKRDGFYPDISILTGAIVTLRNAIQPIRLRAHPSGIFHGGRFRY